MTNSLLKTKKLSAVIALALASSATQAADLGVANNFSAFVFDDFKSNVGRADGAIAPSWISRLPLMIGRLSSMSSRRPRSTVSCLLQSAAVYGNYPISEIC